MKIHSTILLILMLAFTAFGQLVPPIVTGKETPKEKQRIEKKLKEIEKQERKKEDAIRKRTENDKILPPADLDKVGLFPQNYTDQILRFKAVIIAGIEPYSENGETAYFAQIETRERTYYPYPRASALSFLLSSPLAEEFYESAKKYESANGDKVPAHITVLLKSVGLNNGKTAFIANVQCIEFITIIGVKLKKIGEC